MELGSHHSVLSKKLNRLKNQPTPLGSIGEEKAWTKCGLQDWRDTHVNIAGHGLPVEIDKENLN